MLSSIWTSWLLLIMLMLVDHTWHGALINVDSAGSLMLSPVESLRRWWDSSALLTPISHAQHTSMAPLVTTRVHQHPPGSRVIFLSTRGTSARIILWNIDWYIISIIISWIIITCDHERSVNMITKLVSVVSRTVKRCNIINMVSGHVLKNSSNWSAGSGGQRRGLDLTLGGLRSANKTQSVS